MKYFFFIITLICFASCRSQNKNSAIFELSPITDSCYFLKDSGGNSIRALRKMQVIENTLTDTIGIGFGAVPKGYIGEIIYIRLGERRDKALDIELPEKYWPKTDMICIDLYQNRKVQGNIKIQYWY